jgi:ATP-dependent exoDNAse (exonuclease V) beta subunit
MAEVADAGAGDRTDAEGARFVFPALAPAAPDLLAAPRPDAPGAPGPEQVAEASRALAAARESARARAARPFAATASAAAEEDLAELAERRFGEPVRRPPRAGEGAAHEAAVARAVGVAIHRVLEELDLAAEPEAALARARARLEALVRGAAEPGACEAALDQARALLERIARGQLHARLRGLGANVLYRELPVIVPGDGAVGAVGCTAGVVDLVYRDPASGELVVVDYKTDRVESPAELRDCARRYAPQGAVYQRALREALSLAYTPRFELWLLHPDRIA